MLSIAAYMDTALRFIATFTCVLFTGAALYISLVEHPARMACDTACAFAQWAPSYKRATVMQANLAWISALSAIVVYFRGAAAPWLLGGVMIFAVVPTTLVLILPTNLRLLAPGRDPRSAETRALLVRWGRLHGIRTVTSAVASIVFLCLLLSSR
jgi:hypothetical protein